MITDLDSRNGCTIQYGCSFSTGIQQRSYRSDCSLQSDAASCKPSFSLSSYYTSRVYFPFLQPGQNREYPDQESQTSVTSVSIYYFCLKITHLCDFSLFFFAIAAKISFFRYFCTKSLLAYLITILCKIITDIYIPQGPSKN